MPNPVPARYTVQLGPTVTPQVAGELAAWAELQQRSASEVARECIEFGLENLRTRWRAEFGALPGARLAAHVAAAEERGARQVSRRRAYDERTRNVTDHDAGVKPVRKRKSPTKRAA